MIEPFFFALGKHIRYEAVADVMCERAKNPSRFYLPACCEGQSFKTDHRIPAPIGEPVITSYHSTDFFTRSMRPSLFFRAPRGFDYELIRGKHKLCCNS